MAHALVELMPEAGHPSPAYDKRLMAWQARREHWIKRDIGYVPGRSFTTSTASSLTEATPLVAAILMEAGFDPDTDLEYDAQRLRQLETVTPRQIRLRDQVRAYFRTRDEDSTEL